MKRVMIVHGYGGYPDKNWFPWLKEQLQDNSIVVDVPAMPHTDAPQLDEWLSHLTQVIREPNDQLYLVGHSLGCATILRYLESLPAGKSVGGCVLVAAFAEPIHFTELNSFTEPTWNDEHIKQAATRIVVINSDTDPHVPLVMGEHIRDRFNAKLEIMHNAGHINAKEGITQVPLVLAELNAMINATKE